MPERTQVTGTSAFEQLVFSGGGTRCFWHGGFMDAVTAAIELRPARIAAVSGGALSAACFIAGRGRALLDIMGQRLAEREYNLSVGWNELQENGLTPHQQLYRDVVAETLDDEALAAIAEGPAFQIALAHPPVDRWPTLSTIPMMVAYELDLAIRSTPRVVAADRLGANRTVADGRQAAREGKLRELIGCAAVIPPVFEVPRWQGRPVIDGGMTDKAPMPTPNLGRTLVLLTRRFRNLPHDDNCVFVQPGRETPADKIDFTDRGAIERTWELGSRDGRRFLERHHHAGAGAGRKHRQTG